ncbi:MAG: hypothetical protein WBQ31_05615, partial [Candidatus Acidiferrales bacterium]
FLTAFFIVATHLLAVLFDFVCFFFGFLFGSYWAHLLTSFGMRLGFVPIPVSLEPGLHPPTKRQVITLT